MKNIAEKQVYIIQISVYVITLMTFLFVDHQQTRYVVLIGAVIISLILMVFNTLVLGKRNERKK